MGLRLEALRAGYQPKKMPMMEQTTKARTTDWVMTTTGQPIMEPMAALAPFLTIERPAG